MRSDLAVVAPLTLEARLAGEALESRVRPNPLGDFDLNSARQRADGHVAGIQETDFNAAASALATTFPETSSSLMRPEIVDA